MNKKDDQAKSSQGLDGGLANNSESGKAESARHPVVCFGEALWDELPTGKSAGGAPLNVAYHLQKLNKIPAVISRVGFDDLGRELIQTFENKHICTDYFQIDYKAPTGLVIARIGKNHEVSYEIANHVAWDQIQYESSLEDLIQNADYFIYGSLALRNKRSRDTLMKLLPMAKTKVMDLNLRSPFYSKDLIETLCKETTILKLNQDELELLTGWFSLKYNVEDRIKILSDRFHLETVIVTKGAAGAILYSAGQLFHCSGLPVKVADTIGSGDAFLAGLIAKMMDKIDLKTAINFANRLAALITSKSGGCPDYQLDEINNIEEVVQG